MIIGRYLLTQMSDGSFESHMEIVWGISVSRVVLASSLQGA